MTANDCAQRSPGLCCFLLLSSVFALLHQLLRPVAASFSPCGFFFPGESTCPPGVGQMSFFLFFLFRAPVAFFEFLCSVLLWPALPTHSTQTATALLPLRSCLRQRRPCPHSCSSKAGLLVARPQKTTKRMLNNLPPTTSALRLDMPSTKIVVGQREFRRSWSCKVGRIPADSWLLCTAADARRWS